MGFFFLNQCMYRWQNHRKRKYVLFLRAWVLVELHWYQNKNKSEENCYHS